jgi:8-oxo-dGTP pyrophosphatase MutT (NUDIX family)
MDELVARVAANLAAFKREEIPPDERRRASVAILLSPVDGVPTYAITRRAMTLRRGAGNFALPGGGVDPGEDALAAAIRETEEELGVTVGRDALLGMLDDFVTLNGQVVTPVVLWSATEITLNPNPEEVHEAWRVPLEQLDHPEAPRRAAPAENGAQIIQMFVQGHWINPPTAAWLYQFREVALHGRHTRVREIGQPSWTAR